MMTYRGRIVDVLQQRIYDGEISRSKPDVKAYPPALSEK